MKYPLLLFILYYPLLVSFIILLLHYSIVSYDEHLGCVQFSPLETQLF